MNYSQKLSIILLIVLGSASQIQNAAETTPSTEAAAAVEASTETSTEAAAEDEAKQVEEKAPVEVDPADPVAAGKAKHAFKEPNICEGMAEGEFLGSDVCTSAFQPGTKCS